MSDSKIQTSVYLNYHIRKKLKRLSNILNTTETALMERALSQYFTHSKIVQEGMKKIKENNKFLEEIGAVAVKKLCHFNNEGYMYQPQYHEREVDE